MKTLSKFPQPWSRLLDNMATAVLWLDERARVIYANQAAEVLYGLSVRHMVGERPSALTAESNGLAANIDTALESGQAIAEWESVFIMRRGEHLTVDYVVTPINSDIGTDLLLEIRQVDRQLSISRTEIRQTQQNVSRELIRGLAHEIKNPLGGLRGAAQLLEMELNDPALQEYSQIIVREADRLRNLVDRLLGPNQRLNPQTINVHRIVERVRNLIEVEAADSITVERDYDPSIPDIEVDQDLLIQALLNVARNGMQAMQDADTTHARLIFRTRAARKVAVGNGVLPRALSLEIIDNGPGIDESMSERIFYPMVTGRDEGTGLGLPIAQTIINQHGGSIICKSSPGQTRFTLYLPFTQAQTANAATARREIVEPTHE